MFILLNGAFGIGKTTTAKAIVEAAADTAIYDPEPVGVALQRLSKYVRPKGRVGDFQDLAAWRVLTVWGARLRHRRAGAVIVPMGFTNLDYFQGLASTLSKCAPVYRLCLVANFEVVRERLERRALVEGTPVDRWAVGRVEECCRAHRSPAFGHAIDAMRPTPEIISDIFSLGIIDRRH